MTNSTPAPAPPRFEFSQFAGIETVDNGDYCLHSDYAALQASHARLLKAAHAVVVADDEQSMTADEIETLREAIAAAQPFTET